MRAGLLKALTICGLAIGAGGLVGCDEEEWEDFVEEIEDVNINVDVDHHHDDYDDHSFWFDFYQW